MSYVIIGLIIVACIIHSVLKKSKETADQAVNDAIVPGVMNALFDDVQMHPEGYLLDVKGSNIPLQTYSYLNSSGNICFRYQGHPAELCSITLTDVNDYIDENNDMRQTNEQEIYRGQWMCCLWETAIWAYMRTLPRCGGSTAYPPLPSGAGCSLCGIPIISWWRR